MKVAIYFPDFKPENGGANTLLGTILEEIKSLKYCKYSYVVLYRGKGNEKKAINGIEYIDIGYLFGHNFISKAVRKIRELLLGYSILDSITKKEAIDLIYFPESSNLRTSTPFIYTVWDLGHRTTPRYPEVSKYGEWNRREAKYKNMLPKASYIITGNNTGKQEIIQYYNIEEKRIKICEFPASSFCFGKEKKPTFINDNENDYFFYPAQFWCHKNHECIVEATRILKYTFGIYIKVFFTGTDKGNANKIQRMIKKYGLEEQIFITGFLEYEELKYLYSHANAMIFASMMGPNNLPPIEATVLECPVIITELKGHVEQLGESAIYFDGNKPDDLAKKIKLFISNNEIKKEMLEKGKPYREKFKNINYFKEISKIIDEFFMNDYI